MSALVRGVVRGIRAIERRFGRRTETRCILVDARTPVNFTMVAPVYRALSRDARIRFYFTASEEPQRLAEIYHEAAGIQLVAPSRAAFMKFDAYIASDFMWASLVRETRRIQVFHGVAGKYGFDAPERSMREWHRLFFINERRLRNFIARGAVDADSPAIRLVGMPKADCLVDGTYERSRVLESLGLDPGRPTVLYAPTWSPASSLNALGEALVRAVVQMPVNLIVKLHDRSRDLRPRYSGGVDWVSRLEPLLPRERATIATGHDISPYLVAADLMVTDHSSAGFEFLLRDRPLVRIHRPQLIEQAHIHADYVALLASVSRSVQTLDETVTAIEDGLADPTVLQAERRRVAGELFYRPGGATARSVVELYDVLELEPAEEVVAPLERRRAEAAARMEAAWQQTA